VYHFINEKSREKGVVAGLQKEVAGEAAMRIWPFSLCVVIIFLASLPVWASSNESHRAWHESKTPPSFMQFPIQYVLVNDIPKEKQYIGWRDIGRPILLQPQYVDPSYQVVECGLNETKVFRRQHTIVGSYERLPLRRRRKAVGSGREFVPEIGRQEKGRSLPLVRNPKEVMPIQGVVRDYSYDEPRTFRIYDGLGIQQGCFSGFCGLNYGISEMRSLIAHALSLASDVLGLAFNDVQGTKSGDDSADSDQTQNDIWEIFRCKQTFETALRVTLGPIVLCLGCPLLYCRGCTRRRRSTFWLWFSRILSVAVVSAGWGALTLPAYYLNGCKEQQDRNGASHGRNTVPQQYVLTSSTYWGTVIGIRRGGMPNVLSTDKQVAVISALTAWAHDTDNAAQPRRHVTVLHIPPVVSPVLAVRAAIMQEFRNAEAES
jgi:hypothetical protein